MMLGTLKGRSIIMCLGKQGKCSPEKHPKLMQVIWRFGIGTRFLIAMVFQPSPWRVASPSSYCLLGSLESASQKTRDNFKASKCLFLEKDCCFRMYGIPAARVSILYHSPNLSCAPPPTNWRSYNQSWLMDSPQK